MASTKHVVFPDPLCACAMRSLYTPCSDLRRIMGRVVAWILLGRSNFISSYRACQQWGQWGARGGGQMFGTRNSLCSSLSDCAAASVNVTEHLICCCCCCCADTRPSGNPPSHHPHLHAEVPTPQGPPKMLPPPQHTWTSQLSYCWRATALTRNRFLSVMMSSNAAADL